LCLQGLRVSIIFPALALLLAQASETVSNKEVVPISILAGFITFASYGMGWARAGQQLASIDQTYKLRQASVDLFLASLWIAIAAALIEGGAASPKGSLVIYPMLISHWITLTIGLVWGILGLDSLLKVAQEGAPTPKTFGQ
jgi:hypothetical protein